MVKCGRPAKKYGYRGRKYTRKSLPESLVIDRDSGRVRKKRKAGRKKKR